MSNLTDAQTLAQYNAEGHALTEAMSQKTGVAITESVTSGTPFQISTVHDAFLYISIQTAAAMTLSMGPEAAGTSIPICPSEVNAIGVINLHVPAGFYVKFTGTVADCTFTALLQTHENG